LSTSPTTPFPYTTLFRSGGETRQKTDVGQGIVDEGWLLGERDRTNGEPSKGDERDAESDIREDTANDGEQVGALDPHRDQGDERDGRKGAFLWRGAPLRKRRGMPRTRAASRP